MNNNNIEVAYEDCVNLIRSTVWSFMCKYNKHPNEFDDWMSVANEFFMEAYKSYKSEASKFTAWVRTKVWYGLVWKNWLELKHTHINAARPPRPSNHQDELSLIDLLDELNEDAKNLILLMRSAPEDLERLFKRSKKRPARKSVFQYLKQAGWTRANIQNAFNSLKGLLTN